MYQLYCMMLCKPLVLSSRIKNKRKREIEIEKENNQSSLSSTLIEQLIGFFFCSFVSQPDKFVEQLACLSIVNFQVYYLGDFMFCFIIYYDWWQQRFELTVENVRHYRFKYGHMKYQVCYESELKGLSSETTLVLSNTRELNRVPNIKQSSLYTTTHGPC